MPSLSLFLIATVTTFLILFLSSFTVCASQEQEVAKENDELPKSLMIELNDSNFEKTVQLSKRYRHHQNGKENHHHHQPPWFIFFYSSSCFGCQTILPSIEMFATNHKRHGKHNVHTAKVDCNPLDPEIFEASQQTCKRFKVEKFPTMIYITGSSLSNDTSNNNKKRKIYNYFNYRGEQVHTADSLLQFVKDPEGAVLGEVKKKIAMMEEKGQQVPQMLREFNYKPWDDDKVPEEILTFVDEFWYWVEEVNYDVKRRSNGMVHPIFFWILVLFIGLSMIVILIVSVFDLVPRRRRISEIRKQQALQKKKD